MRGPDQALRRSWQQRVKAWRESGMTARAYCAAHALSVHSLRQWAWRLRREAESQSRLRLLPVEVAAPSESQAWLAPVTALSLRLPSGVMIQVPPGADIEAAARLARALSC